MRPVDLVNLLLIGSAVLALCGIVWFFLRRKRKWAIILSGALLIAYASFAFYYPTLQINTHAKRYDQLMGYLADKYPEREFTVTPEHYEGYYVGSFTVNDTETPTMGMEMAVNRSGDITEASYWSKLDSLPQQELWKELEFSYGFAYTLDKKIPEITKLDEWIDGGLTAFALSINDNPAIALYDYSDGGYSQLDLQEGEHAGYSLAEHGGRVFIHVDENFSGDTLTVQSTDGTEYTLDTRQKGRLIVEE